MNAQTPITIERGILELLADPILLADRARDLLETIKQAETVQAKAIAAKIEADQAMKAVADKLTRAEELQEINGKKSTLLSQRMGELEESVKAAAAAKADDVKRLAEWEQRLKAQQAALDEREDAVSERFRKVENDLRDLEDAKREAQAMLDKAEAVRAAMG